jgi:hypothetical protein
MRSNCILANDSWRHGESSFLAVCPGEVFFTPETKTGPWNGKKLGQLPTLP